MGNIIGGLIGGAGSIAAANTAAKASLTGYNYLSGNAINKQAQAAGQTALDSQGQIQKTEQALLTGGPGSTEARSGYANYLNSTGYQFQRDQGSAAITGNAASRGVLNSGGTAKALARFGQNIGGQYFGNYLNQLGNVNSQLQSSANAGIGAAGQVGAAGSAGGKGAAEALQSGISSGVNQLGSAVGGAFNFFGL